VNVTALDVPPEVVITTCAEGEVDDGTVMVHAFCAGQLVGATWPLNVATIWPLVLKKLEPATVTLWPAEPLEGSSAEMTGGPPGATAAVLDVAELDELGEVLVEVEPPLPALVVDGGWVGGVVPVWTPPAAVEDGGAELPLSEMINAMAAASTRAAATATERTNQRSVRPDGGSLRSGGVTSTGRAAGRAWPDGGGASGAAPTVSRARRTALSMAPRAREPGLPGGGPGACSSAMCSSDAYMFPELCLPFPS
jgi:hypothetical protein